jgi:RNA polymerase sigma factor (sigma-70 family)
MLYLARDGDDTNRPPPQSYESLYEAFGPPTGRLVRILMRMGCEREASCDIAQDALWRLAPRFDEVPNPEAWATKAATNLFISRCRHMAMRARRLRALPACTHVPDHGTAVADHVAIAQCLASLKPIQRAVIVLRYFEGYRLREIAEVLGKPESTVKYWGLSAEDALRRALRETT